MLLEQLIYWPSIIGIFLLGMLTFLQGRKNVNKFFFFVCTTIAAWLTCQFFVDRVNSSSQLWIEISFIFFELMTPAFYGFVYTYPDNRVFSKSKKLLLILPVVIFGPFTFSNVMIENVDVSSGSVIFTPGPLYILQTAVCASYIIASLFLLFGKFRRYNSREKNQVFLLITAVIFPLIGTTIAGLVFVNEASAQFVRPLSFFLMALFVSYGIIYHRLFDVRFFVVRALGYAVSVAVLAGSYGFVSWLITTRLLENSDTGALKDGLNIALLLAVAISFTPLKLRFDKVTNRLFYKDAYDTQDVLGELNRHVLSTVDVGPLLNKSAEIVNRYLKTSFCSIELRPTAYNEQRILGDSRAFSEEDILVMRNLTAPVTKRVIVTEDLQESDPKLYRVLNKYDIGAVSKMTSSIDYGLEGIGLILFGIKKSGNAFSEQDKRVIAIISSELTIATQNALRFEEIENFNVTLQDKVDDATKRLKRANDKLKAMDETKDEFISMASHQLRTPLTSVKGYVSMVLEGDAGPLNETQHKLLEQSFASSQRMVFLIADLLNLSRLRTGKFVIENKPTNLADVIESEIEQLKASAASRNLTLTYDKPKNFPELMLDETKIRQVVMNFSDNAIYYTPTGGKIDIKLRETKDSVEFTVNDNGIGIPVGEQHHLFNKFYRAKNAQKARPDGTGLGLFMAKKVIIAQGGAIIFKSIEGKGSTFGFTFSKQKLKVPEITPSAKAK